MEVHIAQQDANGAALWGAFLTRLMHAVFQGAGFQPAPHQAEQARVADSVLDEAEQPVVVQTPKEVLQIRLKDPAHLPPRYHFRERGEGVMGTLTRPPAERAGQEVLLVDGGQHVGDAALQRPVGHTWHANRTLLALPWFGDVHPPYGRCRISPAVHGPEHRLDPRLELLLRFLHCLPIHARRRLRGHSTEVPPNSVPSDMMRQ